MDILIFRQAEALLKQRQNIQELISTLQEMVDCEVSDAAFLLKSFHADRGIELVQSSTIVIPYCAMTAIIARLESLERELEGDFRRL